MDDNDQDDDLPSIGKEKFTRTQQIRSQKDDSDEVKADSNKHKKNGSFSKTMSKTDLLNKIRKAMGKQSNNNIGNTQNLMLQIESKKETTPMRLIVKRS